MSPPREASPDTLGKRTPLRSLVWHSAPSCLPHGTSRHQNPCWSLMWDSSHARHAPRSTDVSCRSPLYTEAGAQWGQCGVAGGRWEKPRGPAHRSVWSGENILRSRAGGKSTKPAGSGRRGGSVPCQAAEIREFFKM